jgi:hypothetical protein
MLGTRTAAVALLSTAVALTGCGDGGGGGVSKEEFAKRANRICNQVEREIDRIGGANADTPEEVAALIDQLIAKSRETVARMKKLERPGGDAADTAEQFVSTLGTDVEKEFVPALEDLRDAIEKKDQRAANAAGRRLDKLEGGEADRLAEELGASGCASGS